jgi:hypothetical protein
VAGGAAGGVRGGTQHRTYVDLRSCGLARPEVASERLHLGLSGWRSQSAETRVHLALYHRSTRKAPMELESLRLLIRAKLQEGLLPSDSIPSVWGDPGNGETCDGCDSIIESPHMVVRRPQPAAVSRLRSLLPLLERRLV